MKKRVKNKMRHVTYTEPLFFSSPPLLSPTKKFNVVGLPIWVIPLIFSMKFLFPKRHDNNLFFLFCFCYYNHLKLLVLSKVLIFHHQQFTYFEEKNNFHSPFELASTGFFFLLFEVSSVVRINSMNRHIPPFFPICAMKIFLLLKYFFPFFFFCFKQT